MGNMGICATIVLGGIAGWLASMIAGTNARQGLLGNIIVGIVGAVIGGFVFNFFGGHGVTGFTWHSLLVATVGGAILLFVKQLLFGKK